MRRIILALALLACALPVGALAKGKKDKKPAEPAKAAALAPAEALTKAKALMAEGDFDKAITTLDKAVTTTQDSAELTKLHLQRALCYGALRQMGKARAAFADALAQDPEAALDARRANPEMLAMLEEVRKGIEGDLSVETTAPAEVRVDGKDVGPAPVKLRTAIGRHQIEGVFASGAIGTTSAVVFANKTATAKVEQPAALPKLAVSTEPSGAVVMIDGKEVGTSPLQVELAVGPHTVAAMREGFTRAERSITMTADAPMDVQLTLASVGGERQPQIVIAPGTPPPAKPHVYMFAAGGAVVGLGAGIGLGIASSSASNEMTRSVHGPLEVQQLHDTAQNLSLGANVAYGAAVAAGVAAVILYVAERTE